MAAKDGTVAVSGDDKGVGSLFVRRPVLSIVLNLLIVIAGLAALNGIEVREMPNVDRPVITIRTSYSGATPETVDKEITSVVESAIARTPGIASISSQSSAGSSRVTVEFDGSTDINVAANDLRDAIGGLRSLPDDADPPVVIKADTDSDAIMRLAVTSDELSIQDLTALVDDRVVTRLATVDGVADVQMFGNRSPLVQVIIRPSALAARNLTVADLNTALATVTLDAPAGSMSDGSRTFLVRADASARSAEEIGRIQINPQTSVSDVADVVFGPADRTTTLRVNGRTGLGIGIVRQAKANTLDISAGVHAAVADLNQNLPADVQVMITGDDAEFINGAIHEVQFTLMVATTIVIAIIFLFLRSWRVTLIPAVTVPIALLGTVAAMWMAGFSINILTLLALVLATGLVVDDAIVVIENIARQRSMGLGARAAAVVGTRQVFFAVISTTATLAAVFIPISFFPGIVGSLFAEFGFVLAFAVALSAVIALTLSPMMGSRLVRAHSEPKTGLGRWMVQSGEAMVRVYARILDWCLSARALTVLLGVLFAGAAVIGFRFLPSELSPQEDRGFIPISVNAPQGSTVDYADTQMRQIEEIARTYLESGEARSLFSTTRGGGGGGFMFLTLAPWDQRSRGQAEIGAEINRQLQEMPGVQVSVRGGNSLGIRGGGQGVSFAVVGDDYDELAEASDALVRSMEQDPAFGRVNLSYDTTQPQMSIRIDRQRASDINLPIESISAAVQTILDGRKIGTFYIGDDPIDIRVRTPEGMVKDVGALDGIMLRTRDGVMVPLSSLATFEESAVAPSLPRQDQRRSIPVSAALGEGVDMRAAMDRVEILAAEVLPAGMGITYTGEAKELNTTSSGMAQTFIFALVIVLLVLAAQFESFTSAAILIATVPFGLAAAVFAILLSGGSLNIYSQIGLVMIVGLMAKNGILIVEFANQLRDAGQSVQEAIRNASLIRLRPVVMTMISTVLGGMPLLLTGGAGSEARHALGWIIVGGLGFATLATLFLTPVAYSLLAGFSKPRIAEEQRLQRELREAREAPESNEPTPEEEGISPPAHPAPAE